MTQPLISVLIITYNHSAFIRETVESVLAQEGDNFEVVVADDGSTDGADRVILQLAAEHPGKVVPVVGGPNIGIARNANRGLARCRGRFLALLGGDDLFLPGKLAAQTRWFAADERRVLCGHDAYIFESSTGLDTRRYSDLSDWHEGEGASAFLAKGCPYLPSAVMVRAASIPAYGFDERLAVVIDGKLFVDVLAGGGRYGHLPAVYARYRRHPGNITAHASKRILAETFAYLALVEAEHPELVRVCRKGRARLHVGSGVVALKAGRLAEAREHLRNALLTCPEYSWKVPAWYLLSTLPPAVRDAVVARGRRKVDL
jgi:glycosyltransferase involved in cell wall biosynthesis